MRYFNCFIRDVERHEKWEWRGRSSEQDMATCSVVAISPQFNRGKPKQQLLTNVNQIMRAGRPAIHANEFIDKLHTYIGGKMRSGLQLIGYGNTQTRDNESPSISFDQSRLYWCCKPRPRTPFLPHAIRCVLAQCLICSEALSHHFPEFTKILKKWVKRTFLQVMIAFHLLLIAANKYYTCQWKYSRKSFYAYLFRLL